MKGRVFSIAWGVALSFACAVPSLAAGLSPEESLNHFKLPDGLEIKLSASEPTIRQPVNLMFDPRGRLWVVQYLQYPAPAGLKALSKDQFLRTTYDRVPEPPPIGPKGADRITVLEDPDENGHYRKSKDAITGLNLATSVELGYGGMWVLQTPYLLFYPDNDGDDLPDGDPQVVLSGFGMEDAHAVANHLTWGPDGWLYGCQGSTNTAHIQGHTFQQAAWRYHPRTKRFEVFSEGGGNTFGLEWDEHGDLLTGTNYAKYVAVHYVQGGYFIKNFGKHGALSNPYAFGYFDHVPHSGWRGGHVTQLGIIYQGGAFPDYYNGKWIAPNVLENFIDVHTLTPAGSSFTSKREGEFLSSTDKNFRPVDIKTGPDGAIYVADWYDPRINHVEEKDDWDKTTGRVYRVSPRGLPLAKPFDLEKLPSAELIKLLTHPNDWYARTARRILAERRDASVVPALKEMLQKNTGRTALQALWALYLSGGLDEATAGQCLASPEADVRGWTVRLLCEENQVSPQVGERLAAMAREDPAPTVRSQLACSAKRLPARQGLPIVRGLMVREDDLNDRYIPLLIWWAVESKATSDRQDVLAMFNSAEVWQANLVRKYLLDRLARRYAADRTPEIARQNLETCATLLTIAPGDTERNLLVEGMDKGLEGGVLQNVPAGFSAAVEHLLGEPAAGSAKPNLAAVRLGVRIGSKSAFEQAVALVASDKTSKAERIKLIQVLGESATPGAQAALLKLIGPKQPTDLRAAAMAALARYDDKAIAEQVLALLPGMKEDLRQRAYALLCGREQWAAMLLSAVEAGKVATRDLPTDQVQHILLHGNADLTARVTKLWGSLRPTSSEEKQKSMARVRNILSEGDADPSRGHEIFTATCAQCHVLLGEGKRVGPDLTDYDRTDLNFLIPNIVDPSAAIREEYATYTLKTKNKLILNGHIVESSPASVTIEDGTQRITVPRDQIASLEASKTSRMPEGLLEAMQPQQIRDLFAYLATQKRRLGDARASK